MVIQESVKNFGALQNEDEQSSLTVLGDESAYIQNRGILQAYGKGLFLRSERKVLLENEGELEASQITLTSQHNTAEVIDFNNKGRLLVSGSEGLQLHTAEEVTFTNDFNAESEKNLEEATENARMQSLLLKSSEKSTFNNNGDLVAFGNQRKEGVTPEEELINEGIVLVSNGVSDFHNRAGRVTTYNLQLMGDREAKLINKAKLSVLNNLKVEGKSVELINEADFLLGGDSFQLTGEEVKLHNIQGELDIRNSEATLTGKKVDISNDNWQSNLFAKTLEASGTEELKFKNEGIGMFTGRLTLKSESSSPLLFENKGVLSVAEDLTLTNKKDIKANFIQGSFYTTGNAHLTSNEGDVSLNIGQAAAMAVNQQLALEGQNVSLINSSQIEKDFDKSFRVNVLSLKGAEINLENSGYFAVWQNFSAESDAVTKLKNNAEGRYKLSNMELTTGTDFYLQNLGEITVVGKELGSGEYNAVQIDSQQDIQIDNHSGAQWLVDHQLFLKSKEGKITFNNKGIVKELSLPETKAVLKFQGKGDIELNNHGELSPKEIRILQQVNDNGKVSFYNSGNITTEVLKVLQYGEADKQIGSGLSNSSNNSHVNSGAAWQSWDKNGSASIEGINFVQDSKNSLNIKEYLIHGAEHATITFTEKTDQKLDAGQLQVMVSGHKGRIEADHAGLFLLDKARDKERESNGEEGGVYHLETQAKEGQIILRNSGHFIVNGGTLRMVASDEEPNRIWVTTQGGTSTLNKQAGGEVYGVDLVEIEAGGTFNFNHDMADTFIAKVQGEGRLNVDLSNINHEFTLSDQQGEEQFNGILAIQNATYRISQDKLSKATLRLGEEALAIHNSSTSRDREEEQLGGLIFAGGMLDLVGSQSHLEENHGVIPLTVGKLTIENDSQIMIKDGIVFAQSEMDAARAHNNYLDQLSLTSIRLVNAATVDQESLNRVVTLLNEEGQTLSRLAEDGELNKGVQTIRLTEQREGEVEQVGSATYDFLGILDQTGISIAYGLTELSANKGSTLVVNQQTALSDNHIMSAKLTGEGGFDFFVNSGEDHQPLVVAHQHNDYKGDTHIYGGTLLLGADNALGRVGDITIAKGGRLALGGKTQEIGKGNHLNVNEPGGLLGEGSLIFNDVTSVINLNQQEAGDFTPALIGAGQLKINHADSEVILVGNNREFSGTVKLEGTHSKLGFHIDETNKIDHIGSATIVADEGSEATIAIVTSGGGNNTLNATVKGAKDTAVIIASDGQFGSANTVITQGYTAGETYLRGAGSGLVITDRALNTHLNLAKETALMAGGNATIKGDIINAGKIYIGSQAAKQLGSERADFGTLIVEGDYIAHSGSALYFAGNYAKDDSPTDKLLIKGDLVGGGSKVHVENIKGVGGETEKGILLIDAESSGNKDAGFFTLEGDGVSAGEYIYNLKGDDGQWLLQSVKKRDPNQPGGGVIPGQPNGNGNNLLNPQTGSYLANQYAANTIFNHKIHDRRYFDADKQLWGRIEGHFGKFRYASGVSAKVDYEHYVTQLGGDLFRHAEYPFIIGAMGAYGHIKSEISEYSENTFYTSKGQGNGYALGLYATYGSVEDFYFDGWIQYVHMSSKVKNEFVANSHDEERYKNSGFVASLEVGKGFQVAEALYIQPQGQITWMGVQQESHTGRDGFRVDAHKENLQIRLGMRFMGRDPSDNALNPYAELNYFHNRKPFGVRYDNGRAYEMNGSRNLGQLKVGVNGHLKEDTALWGEISHTFGRKRNHYDTKLTLGIEHLF